MVKKKVKDKQLTRGVEDYLEAIYLLGLRQDVVRVRDIAQALDVSMPSVTGMLRTLASKVLVTYKRYGHVLLTEDGKRIAKEVLRKHNDLKEFLTYILGFSEKEAQIAACGLEHALSGKVAQRLEMFVLFVRRCPRCGDDLIERFNDFLCARAVPAGECRECVESCRATLKGAAK